VTEPTHRTEPIDRLLAPFREFAGTAAAGGLVLIAAALVALVWANSPFASAYDALFDAPLTVGVGEASLTGSIRFWINDALMAVFFLLVGLEIKREVLVGELASPQRAALPVAAAAGGAVLPAVLFLAIAGGSADAVRGWGIPMATDIAFALGVLALLGPRIPPALRVFLAALAIADDLMAVVVIAVFYTSDVSLAALGAVAVIVAALIVANQRGVGRPIVYAMLGVALWIAVYASGVHPTIAGVLLAATIPAGRVAPHGANPQPHERTLLERMEHALDPWVSWAIVPLFALANAGVSLAVDPEQLVAEPVVVGVVLGLLIGKQVGITAAAWLVVRTGIARLPAGVRWRHVYGVGWLGGIGFTMSLFIAELAYGPSEQLELAKLGVLAASAIAAIGGLLVLGTARLPAGGSAPAEESSTVG
jgi:Na+:H+ antiporter, NhaA family